MSEAVVIVSATRTAIGNFNGSLKDIKATELGATVIRAALEKAGVAGNHVDEVFLVTSSQQDLVKIQHDRRHSLPAYRRHVQR